MFSTEHVFLLHGYSDRGRSLDVWRDALLRHGGRPDRIHTATFETLSNELRIADISEAFEAQVEALLGHSPDLQVSILMHSTGCLVAREWLRLHPSRRTNLRHLIGLSPASFGSPLAHRGRSWLGAMLKGNRELGPDFLEAGNQILCDLELGSAFLWDLAHSDLLGQGAHLRRIDGTLVAIFCGDQPYAGIRRAINPIESDGTVRIAGSSLRARKAYLDLTAPGNRRRRARGRFFLEDLPSSIPPPIPAEGLNHGTILSAPTEELIADVVAVLRARTHAELTKHFESHRERSANWTHPSCGGRWMQLVVRAIDDRGSPIYDFHFEIAVVSNDGSEHVLQEPEMELHRNTVDSSVLVLHFDCDWIMRLSSVTGGRLVFRVTASSGTRRIGYLGYGSEKIATTTRSWDDAGKWDAVIDVHQLADSGALKFFEPLTTTLLEVRLDRQPLPLGSANEVLRLA